MRKSLPSFVFTVAALGLSLSTGCLTDFQYSGELGVVAGGVQDIGYARQVIEEGGVPEGDSITVGGLLNEHDLPLDVDGCEDVLCMDGAAGAGWIEAEAADSIFLQLGYDTALTADSFQREDQNLIAVIDISGSMAGELEDIRYALHALLNQLSGRDALGIVVYGSQGEVLLDLTQVTHAHLTDIEKKIDALETGGSTNMEDGLLLGFRMARDAADANGRQTRVMLFTDVQPNTGSTSAGAFATFIQDGADDDIGFTLFGIGDQFGYGLALEISTFPLSNYFFLDDSEGIRECFDTLDLMVTPIARDVHIQASTSAGFDLVEAYNVVAAEGEGPVIEAVIPTLFLSEGNGASIFRLRAPEGVRPMLGSTVATLSLSYEDLLLDPGSNKDMEVGIRMSDAAGGFDGDAFGHASVRKGAVLVNAALSMIDLCTAFHDGEVLRAIDSFDETVERLASEAAAFEDADLAAEVTLLNRLRANALEGEHLE